MPNKPIINLGIAPDTGTGDSARRGGEKINNLAVDTYTLMGDNAFVLDNADTHYGTRSTFAENSFMVGELHPGGRWQRVVARDSIGAGSVRSDGSNANIFYTSRGEQLAIDLTGLSIAAAGTDTSSNSGTPNNRFQIILPLAREGDVVRIRDVNRTWGLDIGRSQATGIDVWTTPFNFRGDDGTWEWGARTPNTGTATRPAAAHTNINRVNRSRSAVTSDNGNTPIDATVQGPLRITVVNADLEFVYAGHSYGWVVNASSSFNPDNEGNDQLMIDSDSWSATYTFDTDGDSDETYSVVFPASVHTKGVRPIVQVEERAGNNFRITDATIDIAATEHTLLARTDGLGTLDSDDTEIFEGDIVISVTSPENRFIGRIIAANGI